MINKQLLSIICCPETRQTLSLADASLVSQLNEKIQSGLLKNKNGEVLKETFDAYLITADATRVYPVKQDIPVLLANEAILL